MRGRERKREKTRKRETERKRGRLEGLVVIMSAFDVAARDKGYRRRLQRSNRNMIFLQRPSDGVNSFAVSFYPLHLSWLSQRQSPRLESGGRLCGLCLSACLYVCMCVCLYVCLSVAVSVCVSDSGSASICGTKH